MEREEAWKVAAKLKKHEENAIAILRELHKNLGEDQPEELYTMGWNEAINEAMRIVSRITNISTDDALWQEEAG